ncbi:MAG: DUF4136 domain-containing protein [Planctomycetaceae bacterium]|nr:DUF4136 domain-containing protein [Planctomycetaceae bacterium]
MSRGRVLALGLLALAGCSSLEVSVDYDTKTDFSKFRTWAWAPEPSAEKLPPRVNPLTLDRARTAIEATLASKGYAPAPADKADFLVAVTASVERRTDVDYGYPGWGWGWGWGYGWGPSFGAAYYPPTVMTYDEAAMAIHILEPRPALRIVWRGLAEHPVHRGDTPVEREEQVREAVRKVLASFPPVR